MARIPYPAPDPVLQLLPAPLNVFRMMSHAASLTRPAIELGLAILGTTALPVRLREMVIMLVADRCGCEYEWVQHTTLARDAGVTDVQLAAIVEGRFEPDLFTPAELTALTAAAELLSKHTWTEQTVTALQRYHPDQQVVELAITVGYYTMLAGLMNGLEIDVDPSGEHFTSLANERR
jgi:4-carboxymuconolactone decarboxylase